MLNFLFNPFLWISVFFTVLPPVISLFWRGEMKAGSKAIQWRWYFGGVFMGIFLAHYSLSWL